jgi:Domain of unknown function (DUF4129)
VFAIGRIASACVKRVSYLAVLGVCVCALNALALGRQQSASVPATPFTLSAYTQQVNHWTQAVETLKAHPENAAELTKQLPPSWQVTAGTEHIEVSTDWLRTGLDAVEKSPKTSAEISNRLLKHLQSMQREAQDLAAEAQSIDASARVKLNAILARREFSGVHGPTWLDRQAERLRVWLAKWASRLGMNLAHHQAIVKVFFWVLLICGAAGLLGWMIRQLIGRTGAQDFPLQPPDTPILDKTQQMAQAREAAARGKYRDAIRLAYWATVERLGELGFWSLDPTRTHREYLRLVRSDQPQREPLAVLTRLFEIAWYAAQPSTQDDFQTVMAQLEKLGCA